MFLSSSGTRRDLSTGFPSLDLIIEIKVDLWWRDATAVYRSNLRTWI